MTVRLPAADGAVVLQALRVATGDIEESDGSEPEATPDPIKTPKHSPDSLADALVEVASAYLGGKIASAANPDIYQVIVHVGADALTGAARDVSAETPASIVGARRAGHPADPSRCHLEDGPAISPATAQRIACKAMFSWMLHDHKGNVLDVGRRHRRPPPTLRRAVRERDGYRCQYPACNARRTDIHHIVPWAMGGATELSNLTSLCEAHRAIVHELGLVVSRATDGSLTVNLTDGTLVPASPQLPGGSSNLSEWHHADITSRTIIPSALGDKLDLHFAIWACFANARVAEERRQAQLARQDQQLAA